MIWLCFFDISDGKTRYRFEKYLKVKWIRYQKSMFVTNKLESEEISSLMVYAKGHFGVKDSLAFVPVCETCIDKSECYGFDVGEFYPEVIIL